MRPILFFVVALGTVTFLQCPRESSALKEDSIDKLIDSVVKRINEPKQVHEEGSSKKEVTSAEEHKQRIKEITTNTDTVNNGDKDNVLTRKREELEELKKLLEEKTQAKRKVTDDVSTIMKKEAETNRRSGVLGLRPITLKICSQAMFQVFMTHLCPLKLKKRQRRDLTLPKQQANTFLKTKKHVVTRRSVSSSRQLDHSAIGDIFYLDECCSSKGCSLNEINEYCVV